jgi:hypothetical protein
MVLTMSRQGSLHFWRGLSHPHQRCCPRGFLPFTVANGSSHIVDPLASAHFIWYHYGHESAARI